MARRTPPMFACATAPRLPGRTEHDVDKSGVRPCSEGESLRPRKRLQINKAATPRARRPPKMAPSPMASNDEVERRGVAPTSNEADLSQSSTPSLAIRRRRPAIGSNRLLEG